MEKDKGARESIWDRATLTRPLQDWIHVPWKGAVSKQKSILEYREEAS